ncbi:MAG: tetratricopeptide repeat protein [Planctomycetota bacterium]
MTRHTRFPLAAGLLVVMTLAAYLPASRCGYVWDDDDYVKNNQLLRSLDGLRQIWFEIGATPQYYPLVHTSYWIEYRFWKLNPTGYHLVNIVLHAVGAVLAWRALTVLQVPGAWAAAAVFALHPVHVESVAWITERKNVLSGVFYLGSLLAYLRFAPPYRDRKHDARSGRLYTVSLVLFLCALLSKTVACALPAVLLLLLWWKHQRVGSRDLLALAPFFALGIAFGLLTVFMEKHRVGAMGEEWDLSWVERCLIAGRALCFYAGKLFWPSSLMFNYPRWQIDGQAWRQYLYPAAVTAGLLALWLARRRAGRGPLVAVLVFVGTLVPALGFFNVYPFRYSFVADHFQYLASLGLIALVAGVGCHAVDRLGRPVKVVGATILVSVLTTLGTLTWRQAQVYESLETVFRDTLRKNPDSWLGHHHVASLARAQGRLDEAVSHYRRAIEIKPDSASAYGNLGITFLAQGRFDEAITQFYRVLQIDPHSANAHRNLGNALRSLGNLDAAIRHYRLALQITPEPDVHNSLGIALSGQGKRDEAINHFRQAVQLAPGHVTAHYNLATTLSARGSLPAAIRHYRQVLRITSDHAEAHYGLGNALKTAGRFDAALEHLREAARLRTDWPAPINDLAWLLATHPDAEVRDAHQAIPLAERAAELTGHQNVAILDTLAAAYAAEGRFEGAVTTAQAALALPSAARADTLANEIRMRLELYRQARPYREPVQSQPR